MLIIITVGTPAAYTLARAEFPGKRAVDSLIDIPAVLPPSAAGIALLLTFGRVTVPLSFPAIVAGAVMAWARALGEFGGTIIFAGSFPGITQTIPLAIFAARESNFDAAVALSVMVLGFAFTVILVTRHLLGKAAEVGD